MAISVDPNTGWSEPLKLANKSALDKVSDFSIDSTYVPIGRGTWFTDTWWMSGTTPDQVWAKKFTNVTNMKQKLLSASFIVCTGHSNNKYFASTGGTKIVHGRGCTFTATVYVEGIKEAHPATSSVHLPTIDRFNCGAHGVPGDTDISDPNETWFGNPNVFGPGTAYEKDSQGNLRGLHPETFEFTGDIIIEPGQSIFVVIHVVSFEPGPGDALLRIVGNSDNWQSTFEEADSNYIWRYVKESDGTKHWVKDRSAFMYMGQTEGWAELT